MNAPEFVYVTYIATTPEKLWQALIDPEFTRRYWYGMQIEIGDAVGKPFAIRQESGASTDQGEVLIYEPPHRLAFTFQNLHIEPMEGPSRVTFTSEPLEEAVRLTVVHDRFAPDSRVLPSVSQGWPAILSGLKSLLETGEVLTFDEPPMPTTPAPEWAETYYVTYIEATPEKVWEALTSSEISPRYFFGRRVESDWKVGSPVRYWQENGVLDVSGTVLRSEPPYLVEFTWRVEWIEEMRHLPDCRVQFKIEPLGGAVRLTMNEFHDAPLDPKYLEGGRKGWPMILAGLKALVETGAPLNLAVPGPG